MKALLLLWITVLPLLAQDIDCPVFLSDTEASASGDITTNLRGKWLFASDATDSSGNGNDLTLANDAQVTGGALVLDGTADYAWHAHEANLNAWTGDFTIIAWVKVDSGNRSTYRYFVNKETATKSVGIGVNTDGTPFLNVFSNPTSDSANGATAIDDDNWHKVTGVRAGGNLKFYIDAEAVVTVATTAGDVSSTSEFVVGATSGHAQTLFGSVKAVGIFDRALSVADIALWFATYP